MTPCILPARRTAIFVVSVFLSVMAPLDDAISRTAADAAEVIRTEFEKALFTLPPKTQEHYSARMYRITGNSRYVNPILLQTLITERALAADIRHYNETEYRRERIGRLIKQFNGTSRKERLRHALFEERGEVLYHLNMLSDSNRLTIYGEGIESIGRMVNESIAILGAFDFSDFLLDPAVIRIYAAQTANYVYYLHDLGIVDLRSDYRSAFATAFPNREDLDISNLEYKDKIYGLTHIIIAASGYYQHEVERTEFQWLLHYFEANIDRILHETKPDVIAEVAICFLLAGDRENHVVSRCRKAILKSIDEEAGIILSVSGRDNLAGGEHRNILAYMLLSWPDELHSGPRLGDFSDCARVLNR